MLSFPLHADADASVLTSLIVPGQSSLIVPKFRVPKRFFGILDLAYFKAGIRDFDGKGGRDS